MSELLNALNPDIANGRARARPQHRTDPSSSRPHTQSTHDTPQVQLPQASPQASPQLPPPQPKPNVPYSSELELAMVVPQPAPPPPPAQRPLAQVPHSGQQVIQEMFRVIHATKEASEQERQRRIAWEQEQEAKYAQERADMERRLQEMKAQMSMMQAYMTLPPMHPQVIAQQVPATIPPLPAPSARIEELPVPAGDGFESFPTPITPEIESEYVSSPQPTFIQGSSSHPIDAYTSPPASSHLSPRFLPSPLSPRAQLSPRPSSTPMCSSPLAQTPMTLPALEDTVYPPVTPALPSPAQTPVVAPAQPPGRRKRRASALPEKQPRADSVDEDSDTEANKRRKNGHDTRCLTVQHAVRVHVYRSMGLDTRDSLPESHEEDEELSSDSPVRFVWGRTLRQSTHNAAMKQRIIADLIAQHSKLYKSVPVEDFNRQRLESAFDQTFKTLNQKWKIQQDQNLAKYHKHREDKKAQKSRRRERKKTKLKKRTGQRKKFNEFAHPIFDPAFFNDCISSEESCDEDTDAAVDPTGASQLIQIRGLPWRSSRLRSFYEVLDEEEPSEVIQIGDELIHKPRRAVPRKERCIGPPKDVYDMPPKGVAGWMVSRRWMNQQLRDRPDLQAKLKELIADDAGFDWNNFHLLGGESEDEFEPPEQPEQPIPQAPPITTYIPQPNMGYSSMSSSLAHALVPM